MHEAGGGYCCAEAADDDVCGKCVRLITAANDGDSCCGDNEWRQVSEHADGPTETTIEGNPEGTGGIGEDPEQPKEGEGEEKQPDQVRASTLKTFIDRVAETGANLRFGTGC